VSAAHGPFQIAAAVVRDLKAHPQSNWREVSGRLDSPPRMVFLALAVLHGAGVLICSGDAGEATRYSWGGR
jgi:hypothetical protein